MRKKEIIKSRMGCTFAGIGNKLILSIVVGVQILFRGTVIKDVLSVIPQFIIDGMDVAAGILPAVRFAML